MQVQLVFSAVLYLLYPAFSSFVASGSACSSGFTIPLRCPLSGRIRPARVWSPSGCLLTDVLAPYNKLQFPLDLRTRSKIQWLKKKQTSIKFSTWSRRSRQKKEPSSNDGLTLQPGAINGISYRQKYVQDSLLLVNRSQQKTK